MILTSESALIRWWPNN